MLMHKQVGDVGIESSQGWARHSMELMVQNNVPPTPSNYCLWYNYAASSIPSLKQEMDDMLQHGIAFTMQETVRLFEKYFGTDREAKGLERIGSDLTQALSTVVKQIGQADKDSSAFGDRLKALDGSLRSVSVGEDAGVQEIVVGLIQATQDMTDKNHALQTQLNKSSAQVTVLRDHLHQVRAEALTDGLTGVANRRCFDLKLVEQSKAALKAGSDLCLVLIDIDHFKRFNDTYGHKVGDQVLKVVGFQLKAAAGADEVPARYGGEEFALILPNCSLDQAAQRADQLRQNLASQYLRNKNTGENFGQVTVSVGVALYRANEPLEDFVARADSALYEAKHKGRNRVISAAA
ncbi:MAG: GGDEF domain-containing protein [Dongiaceae bacterium]